MPLTYAEWPFRPVQERSIEETRRWWQTCYLPGDASQILQSEAHWCIVAGGTGSGRSTAIIDLERHEINTSFIIRYFPERWPGARHALVRDGNHLAQIMAAAGWAVREYLTTHMDMLASLTDMQYSFVRWLLEKFSGPRFYLSWVDGLEVNLASQLRQVTYEDIYPTTDPFHAQGQIDELANLIRKFGYQRVLLTVDLNQYEGRTQLTTLGELFDWLDLMHHPGMALVAAIPIEAVQDANLVKRVRGRVSVTHLKWTASQVREIAIRHLRQAIEDPQARWEDFVSAPLARELENLLLAEYGTYVPLGWVALAESVLSLLKEASPISPFPLTQQHKGQIAHAFFARHMRLQIDPNRHGVWRGPRLIKLPPQRLQFLNILHERNGIPVNSEDRGLIALAGNKGNIHSLASRTREQIEPFPDKPIYLLNKRGEGGYWLENCV